MTGWIVAGALYVIGLVGLHAMVCDISLGHPKEWRSRLNIICWPVTIPFAAAGDVYDRLRHNSPSWLGK